MKRSIIVLLFMLFTLPVFAGEGHIIYHLDSTKYEISKHIYGHFSEHLGRCIYQGIWVGKESNIPHVNGMRKDVVDALKEIAVPNMRWPGGCFACEYHWMDGVGPKEARPTIINTNWGGVTENNHFGTHEFMEFCDMVGCEPVFCGNVGSGTIQEMSQWVEYLNSNNVSEMTELRKANGREEPYGVKYWGLGNENWGCGGNMSAEQYAGIMRRYSTYCKDYGANRLYKVACGAAGDDYHWTETLMQDPKTRNAFQGLSLHYYAVEDWSTSKGSATDFDETGWAKMMQLGLKMEELISKHSAIMDKYDPERRIGLIVDEWGSWYEVEPGTNPGFLYQQNTLRDALLASTTLDIFNNHCERVKMTNIAQVVNVLQSVILTKDDQMVKTPTFYVFKMYKVHHDAMLVPSKVIVSDVYSKGKYNARALQTSCSTKDGKVHVTLSNVDPNESKTVRCSFTGAKKISPMSGEIITGAKINSYNDFGQEETVNISDFADYKADGTDLVINIPAKSVVMVELEAK